MKIRFWKNFGPRQTGLLIVAGLMAVSWLAASELIRPWYDRWQRLRSEALAKQAQLSRLSRNLDARAAADIEFRKLGPEMMRAEPEQMAMSRFLRELEALARLPSLTLVNMKPLPVELTRTHKLYTVRLTAAGDLKDVVTFVSRATGRAEATGMKEFSLRAAQGLNSVECSMTLWTVQLCHAGSPASAPSPASATSGRAHD